MTAAITYLSTNTNSSQSDSYTFSSVGLGAASSDRVIGIVFTGEPLDAPADVNAISVGGVSATKVAQLIEPGEGYTASLWTVAVPTGTTGDIVITLNVDYLQCFCHVWAMTGVDVSSPYDTATNEDDIVNLDCDIPEGGVVFGAAQFGSTNTVATTGLTENYDVSFDGDRGVSGSAGPLSAETPRSISFNGGSGVAAGVVASFAPTSSGTTLAPASAHSDSDGFESPTIKFWIAPTPLTIAQTFHEPGIDLRIGPPLVDTGALVRVSAVASAVGASHVGASSVGHGPEVDLGGTVQPPSVENAQSYSLPAMRRYFASDVLSGEGDFYGAGVGLGLTSTAIVDSGVLHTPLAKFAMRAAPLSDASEFFTPSIDLFGVKAVPLTLSGAVFAPTVGLSASYDVVGTIGSAGGTQRKTRRVPIAPMWPNLPRVEAPPWRLVVVTPDVARQRAREQIAWRKRADRLRRKRQAADVNDLLDLEVARTVARVIGEDA